MIYFYKLKKFWIGISFLTLSGIIIGFIFQNLNNSHNLNNNLQINNESLTIPNTTSNSIYYSGINSSDYKIENNLKTQKEVLRRYGNWAQWFDWLFQGWYDEDYKLVNIIGNGWTGKSWVEEKFSGKTRQVISNNVELTQTSYSDSLIQENITLPVNPKDWANQKYTINTNWSGAFLNMNKTSYTINASPGQQVFTIEDSNIDGYNPATDVGNSGNGDDGMNVDPAWTHGGRDGLKTEIVIDKTINGNVLTAKIYLRVTTVNRGDGNKYYWDGLGSTTITVKSITPALNDISDNDFNSGLQKQLSNLSYVSDWSNSAVDAKNWGDIQKLINSKITAYVNQINLKQNYKKSFNVDFDLTNSSTGNVNLTINYDSLKGSSGTITSGTNQYKTAFNLNVPIKMLLSDKYYGNDAWNNLTFDTNKINYDENTGQISISSNTDLEKSNPWYDLIKAPMPASNQIYTTGTDSPTHPVYPNFGTFYLDHEINLIYKVPPGQKGAMKFSGSGPGISVTMEENDSGNGVYDARFYDGRFDELKKNGKISPSDINKPTTWTLYIYGNKNGVYGLQMQMTFIIDAYAPQANISYRGWNPTAPVLKDWQDKWITQTLDNGSNNPLYKPVLDPATGLGQEIVWLSGDNLNPKLFINDPSLLNQYNNYPDPIDNTGKLIYSAVNKNADGSLMPNVDTTNLTVPDNSYGIIVQAYVSPKGINEFVNPNQRLFRFKLEPKDINDSAQLTIASEKEIINNTDPSLDYNDTTGIYLYVSENQATASNPNLTYATSVVAIDPTIKNQNFSQYINQKLNDFAKENNLTNINDDVLHFWSSLSGQHLADYLFNVQGMKNDEISKLSYSEILSWWNIYVKNAVLLNQNNVTPKYDLSSLALASIKANTTNADDLKNQVLTSLQDQMNHLADRLTFKKKADLAKVNKGYLWDETRDAVHLIYGQDYYIANLDSINWNSLANLSKTSRQQTLNLKIVATTPNANLVAGSTTNLKVINSLDFNNLYNLFNAQIPAWNANTNSLDVLKQGISDNVNSYLSKITGQTITNSDWYLKESDSEIINSLLPNGSATLQIVAIDASPYLINSTTITVNNQTTNPFDLRNIQIPKLNINSDDKGTIWQSIYNWVKNYVSKNYSNLVLGTDYQIEISDADINAIIDSFNKNSGDYTINQVIVPVNDKTQGYTSLVVNDAKENELVNNVAPVPGSNNPYAPQTPTGDNGANPNSPNGGSETSNSGGANESYFSNKGNIAWVSTVTVAGILLLVFCGLVTYGAIDSRYRSWSEAWRDITGRIFSPKYRRHLEEKKKQDAIELEKIQKLFNAPNRQDEYLQWWLKINDDVSKRGWKYTVGEWEFLHNDDWKTTPIEDWPKLIYSNEEIYVDPIKQKEENPKKKVNPPTKPKSTKIDNKDDLNKS